MLDDRRERLTTALLTDLFDELREWRAASRNPKPHPVEVLGTDPGDAMTPIEAISVGYQRMREATQSDVLERAKAMPPERFERLVVDLLLRLGYGGTHGGGVPLGRTGDGGIDGIIQQDKLGLELIYIQAKRWQGTVGSSVVREFAGSIAARRAHKGVILTTATFSKDALADAERMSDRIVLIDGARLAELMFEVGLGVSVEATYEVKRVDSDYFEPPE